MSVINMKRISSVTRVKERLDYLSGEDKICIYLFKLMYKLARNHCKSSSLILDLGCGLGWGTNYLSCIGKVYGVDIDTMTIKEAKNRYKKNRKIKFLVADAVKLPFPKEKFDAVVAIEIIEHIKDQQKYLDEVRRVLKKRGILIISTPNGEHFGCKLRRLLGVKSLTNPFHFHEFSERELTTLLVINGFKVEKIIRLLTCLPITILNFVQKSERLIKLVTQFTLPGFNVNFLIISRKS